MFHILVSRNDDLKRLVEKGYAVAFDNGFLIVRDIPYLDQNRALKLGAIVSKLKFIDAERIEQEDHQIFFAGSVPHGLDGKPIPNLGGGEQSLVLSEASKDIVVERSFSNKPKAAGKFVDFFEKIESYVSIISAPAIQAHEVSPYTFRTVEQMPDSVFKFHDTLTARADITDLSAKLRNDVIAIIGLGGTGAYVLDFLCKTPVKEIRGFDPDVFHVHTAFRSPGKLDEGDLGIPKARVYQSRYESFRNGLTVREMFVDATTDELFQDVTFAFVCVDKGTSRAGIFDLLILRQIPFIDVGMGLRRKTGSINGMLRATYFAPDNARQLREKGLADLSDDAENIYRSNIQIAELNAFNACMAVLKYKQLRGFYFEELPISHMLFEIGDMKIVSSSDEI